jgi:hypothetical protein
VNNPLFFSLILSSAVSLEFSTNIESETGSGMRIFVNATLTSLNLVIGIKY